MSDSERKPLMNEHRRKVLDLLEFCSEADPYCTSIHELLRGLVGGDNLVTARDWSDKELSVVLQEYADKLLTNKGDIA